MSGWPCGEEVALSCSRMTHLHERLASFWQKALLSLFSASHYLTALNCLAVCHMKSTRSTASFPILLPQQLNLGFFPGHRIIFNLQSYVKHSSFIAHERVLQKIPISSFYTVSKAEQKCPRKYVLHPIGMQNLLLLLCVCPLFDGSVHVYCDVTCSQY